MTPQEQTLTVARTARYYKLGGTPLGGIPPGTVKDIWFVLHGFGQLAKHFIRRFDVIASDSTLVVAPEGLSRAYLNGDYSQIGASWITRENREAEITDYVAYLNQLYDQLLAPYPASGTWRITLLGFSQGAATACRWLNAGHIRADRLILWAGFFAHGLGDMIDPARLHNASVYYVYGEQDEYLAQVPSPDTYLSELQTEVPTLTIVPFAGGHTVSRDVLLTLA